MHGLAPGPMLFEKNPEVVYGLYAGLFVANIAMLLIGLVILTPCLWLVNRPKPYLMAFVFALVVSGIYAIEQSLFDVGARARRRRRSATLMRWFGLPQLPMVLGVVLGFMVESNYRRSLVLSGGDHRDLRGGSDLARRCSLRPRWSSRSRSAASSRPEGRPRHDRHRPRPIAERLAAARRRVPGALRRSAARPRGGRGAADRHRRAVRRRARAPTTCAPRSTAGRRTAARTAIGHARTLDAAGAAFVNGTAAHGEDFDDTFEGGPVHAGAVIVPAHPRRRRAPPHRRAGRALRDRGRRAR